MKISTVVNNLGPSQKSFYMIKEFNKLSKNSKYSCCAFTEISGVFVTRPLFSCLSVAFFSDYSGIAIATTISEAKTILETSNKTEKFLYLWDMEWTQNIMNHHLACSILRDPRLKIIARSESHARAIENFCNKKPVGIVDDWNHSQLLKIIGGSNEN
jgi:hypothetical protein